MFFKKYRKLSAFILLVALVVCSNNEKVNAKKVSNTTYTYYSNNKVKTKFIKTVDGSKLINTKMYSYNTKGKATKLKSINYGKDNKKLIVASYVYKKNKQLKKKIEYFYNTHSKAKTKKPLNKSYKVSMYNKKGKLSHTIYRSKAAQRKAVVDFARKQNGKNYRSGGKGPKSFDCSGLTSYVYKKSVNKKIGASSYAQNKKGKYVKISKKTLKPGDVLFWGSKKSPYHVGIYLGNGKYIHAGTHKSGVVIKKLNSYKPSYAKRLI